jgi:DNA-binding transcriptional LysR family regulator
MKATVKQRKSEMIGARRAPDEIPLSHLETFVRIVRDGSFTGAAIAMNLNQSSVSSRLSSLEDNLGEQLLDRRGGRVELTEAGRSLLPYAEQVLSMMRQARSKVHDAGRGIAYHTLKIGSNGSSALAILPDVLPRYHALDPHSTVAVEVRETSELMELMSHEAIKLAFVNPLLRHSMSEVVWSCSLPVALVARADHRLSGKAVSIADLSSESIVAYSLGHAAVLTQELRIAAGGALPSSIESNSTPMVLTAIESGMGIGFLPRRAIAKQLAEGSLVALRIRDYEPRPWDIVCVHWRGREIDPEQRLFIQALAGDGSQA